VRVRVRVCVFCVLLLLVLSFRLPLLLFWLQSLFLHFVSYRHVCVCVSVSVPVTVPPTLDRLRLYAVLQFWFRMLLASVVLSLLLLLASFCGVGFAEEGRGGFTFRSE